MAIVAGIAAGAGAVVVGAGVGTALAVGLAGAAVYDYVEDSLTPDIPDASVDTISGRNVTTKNPTAFRDVVYGKVRKGGVVVMQAVSGESNKYFHQIIALSHGNTEAVESVWFGDEKAWENGSITNAFSGNVLTVEVKTGTSGQSYFSMTEFNDWTSSHKLSGITYVKLRLTYDTEKYPNGIPKVTAIVKGRKVYDPRTMTTGYSTNPVLCLYNYLRDDDYGAGLSSDLFDSSELSDDADYCDEIHYGQTRYSCNGVVKTSLSIRENIKNMLSCMHGKLLFVNGKFKIKPLRPVATHSTTLTEDMIVGDFAISHTIPRQSQYNIVKGEFVNAESNYIKTEYPQQTDDSFVEDDGEELIRSLNLPFTTNHHQAQRLANIELRKSRLHRTLRVKVNARGFDYAVNDVIRVKNDAMGIVSMLFQITKMQINFDAQNGVTCDIEANEYSTNLANQKANSVAFSQSVVALPKQANIAKVTNIRYAFYHAIGGNNKPVLGMRVNWTAPRNVNVDYYEVNIGDSANSRGAKKYTTTQNFINIVDVPFYSGTAKIYVDVYNRAGQRSGETIKTFSTANQQKLLDSQHSYEGLIIDGDPSVALTDQDFIDHFGRTPAYGDTVTVIEKTTAGKIIDAETYTYTGDIIIVRPVIQRGVEPIVTKNTETAQQRLTFSIANYNTNNAVVTWTATVSNYESNDSSTAFHTFNTQETGIGASKNLQVTAALPAIVYNTRTCGEDILFNKGTLTVTASYTTGGLTYNDTIDVELALSVTGFE